MHEEGRRTIAPSFPNEPRIIILVFRYSIRFLEEAILNDLYLCRMNIMMSRFEAAVLGIFSPVFLTIRMKRLLSLS